MSVTIIEMIPASFLLGGLVKLAYHGGKAMLSQEGDLMRKRVLNAEQKQFQVPPEQRIQPNQERQKQESPPEKVAAAAS